MAETVDRTGTFRAEVVSYGMKEYKSGAIGVNIVFRLLEFWHVPDDDNDPYWYDWAEQNHEVFGAFFVVKKDATLNQRTVNDLVEHLGWDGKFDSVNDGTWEPTQCQVSVKSELYEGETRMKASWLSSYDAVPQSGMATLDADKSKSLDAKFGGQIRALAGDKIRQTSKPSSPPPKAPVATADPNAELQQEGHGQTGPGGAGDIAF